MASQPAPAQMRDLIVERLTGETGNPDHVLDTARACAARCVPDIAGYFAGRIIGGPKSTASFCPQRGQPKRLIAYHFIERHSRGRGAAGQRTRRQAWPACTS